MSLNIIMEILNIYCRIYKYPTNQLEEKNAIGLLLYLNKNYVKLCKIFRTIHIHTPEHTNSFTLIHRDTRTQDQVHDYAVTNTHIHSRQK